MSLQDHGRFELTRREKEKETMFASIVSCKRPAVCLARFAEVTVIVIMRDRRND